MIREPSIFFFIRTINIKNNNKTHKVITIPKIERLYMLAPIEFQMIIPGILDTQYINNVFLAFKGVRPAPYINTSFGTKGKLQKINNETNPVLDSKKETILSSFSFLTNLLTKLYPKNLEI